MTISLDVLSIREGVLMYPDIAANEIADGGTFDPLEDSEKITYEVLSTRAGVLRFPEAAASRIAAIASSSSSS
jgi:hypothetical protein